MKTLVINLFFRNKPQGKMQNYPHTENFHILKVWVPGCMIIPREGEKRIQHSKMGHSFEYQLYAEHCTSVKIQVAWTAHNDQVLHHEGVSMNCITLQCQLSKRRPLPEWIPNSVGIQVRPHQLLCIVNLCLKLLSRGTN